MKTKVYEQDWFYNAGIVGFIRILEHNNDTRVIIKENYIEFDTKILKDFHKYYFKYFFDTYNVAKKTEVRVNEAFNKIKRNIEIEEKEKAKTEKKYIKLTIKNQLDKIKKIDDNIYNEMLEKYNLIDKIKEKEDLETLEQIRKALIENIQKEHINKRLTMNFFKNILSKRYFGQPSFLNVVKSGLSYEEQEDLLYRDYVSNIIETDFLQEIIENKYNLESLKEIIKQKLENENIAKDFEKIYNNINKKFLEKSKTLEEIKEYIQEKVFAYCYICENEHTITSNYSESNFIPLALSGDIQNTLWNQKTKFPICDICKLIMLCIPAGVTSITKAIKENDKGNVVYKEKEIYSFINYDANVNELVKYNNNFKSRSKKDKTIDNPYSDFILDIVGQEKEISQWQLQNIFIVEFETEYLSFSRLEYFNIKRYAAKFFIQYAQSSLKGIKDYRYKLEIIEYILKNKDIKYIINQRIREEIKQKNPIGINNFLASKIRMIINILKKEDSNMEETIKKNNNKLIFLYNSGVMIHEKLTEKNESNKLDGYTYKMLNSIKAGNKKEFMDIVIRIHMSQSLDVSPIFLDVMKDGSLDLESIGHSFLSGLVSNRFEKKVKGENENENK